MQLHTALVVGGTALCVFAGSTASGQNLLTNGDFEADPFDAGWGGTATAEAGSGLTAGSSTAAMLLPVGSGQASLTQGLESATGGLWAFEFLYAAEQPTSGTRALQLALQFEEETAESATEPQINLVVSSSGAVEVFQTGSGFQTIIPAGAFVASVDADDDNDLGGAEDEINLFRMRMEGDFGETPTYDVSVENLTAGSAAVTAEDVAFYQYQSPQDDDGIWQVEFITNASGSTYGIDNVSLVAIPEPAGAGLLLGGLALLTRRTRRGA